MREMEIDCLVMLSAFKAAAMAQVAAGQSVADQYLNTHNQPRQAVGAGIPNFAWNSQLQAYATNWAFDGANKARCPVSHSDGPYGENIYWSSWSSTPAEAVTSWVNETQFDNYSSNSCTRSKVCGHYTQVVWRNTKSVGCGSANCPGGGKFVVCSSYPSGQL